MKTKSYLVIALAAFVVIVTGSERIDFRFSLDDPLSSCFFFPTALRFFSFSLALHLGHCTEMDSLIKGAPA